MSFCLPGCHPEMMVSKCFARHCLHVVSVTLGMDQGEAVPTLSQAQIGPRTTRQNLSIAVELPTPHNFPRHKPPFTANVSLCVSWAIVVPSFERIDPATCMYFWYWDWFISRASRASWLWVLVLPHSIKPIKAKHKTLVQVQDRHFYAMSILTN